MENFEPRVRRKGASEVTTKGATVITTPSIATSFCLCCLWVLLTRNRDEDAITLDLSALAFDFLTTTTFVFRLEFQQRRIFLKKTQSKILK
jgi:hypothetical protein